MVAGYREIRGKVGFFGFVFRLLFWRWQALMLYWFIYGTPLRARCNAERTPKAQRIQHPTAVYLRRQDSSRITANGTQ